MNILAVGFWGAFFGTAALMLAGSLVAYACSQRRVALTAALSSLISALFVVTYLGLLPTGNEDRQARLLAHVAILSATVLGHMLLTMLGLLRDPAVEGRVRGGLALLAATVLVFGWLIDPTQALLLSSLVAAAVGAVMLAICVRLAHRGDRQAWLTVAGVACMMVAVAGLSWIALDRANAPWQVHVLSAGAGMAYLVSMGVAMWLRYSYLIELRQVMAYGPQYDPLTRMRSHSETGQMVGLAFFRQQDDASRPLAVITVSIGNLDALEYLHGRAAFNHALFVCANRLRRCVPADVEMGRLGEDGFLLLVRRSVDKARLASLARQVAHRLSRPVALSTGASGSADLEADRTDWQPQVGVGILATTAQVRPSVVVSMAKATSQTAWSFASRVAWHDQASGQITELAAADPA